MERNLLELAPAEQSVRARTGFDGAEKNKIASERCRKHQTNNKR